jgi:hypothetical protein
MGLHYPGGKVSLGNGVMVHYSGVKMPVEQQGKLSALSPKRKGSHPLPGDTGVPPMAPFMRFFLARKGARGIVEIAPSKRPTILVKSSSCRKLRKGHR